MAVIDALPSKSIISGARGTLDYYCYKGLNVVRMWPRSPGIDRTWQVLATASQFSAAQAGSKTLSPTVKASYDYLAQSAPYTWRDWLTRLYLGGVAKSLEHQE